MKTKFIVMSSLGVLGLGTMVLSASTFAANTKVEWRSIGIHSWARMNMLSWGKNNAMMQKFTSTWEAEAFRTAVETAITNNDYTAFVAAHTKYSITKYQTQAEFTTMVTERATQKKIQTALEAWDYTTRKTLNNGNKILDTITTEAQFKQLQEMHSYQEKARTIRESLGLKWEKGEGMGMGRKEWKGMGMQKWNGEHKGLGMYSWNNND